MRKTTIVILITMCLCIELQARQWIVFFAKEGFFDGVIRQSFGHAYIALIWEDPALKQKVLIDCFGYYPKGGIRSEGLFGFMDGEMRDDLASMREHDFAVEITEQELFYCLILKNIWAGKRYSLRANNCIDFMRSYCQAISNLKLPEGFFLLPSTYITALRLENKNRECRDDIKNVIEVDKKSGKFGFIKRQQHKISEKFKKIRFDKIRLFGKDSVLHKNDK